MNDYSRQAVTLKKDNVFPASIVTVSDIRDARALLVQGKDELAECVALAEKLEKLAAEFQKVANTLGAVVNTPFTKNTRGPARGLWGVGRQLELQVDALRKHLAQASGDVLAAGQMLSNPAPEADWE